jgi:lysozyme
MANPRIIIASLSLSAAAFVGMLGYEGWCGKACIPVPGDVPTIGFGTTSGVKMGDTITPPKAVERAYEDVAKFEGAIKQCVTVPLKQTEYDAYAQLAYNIGPTAFCGSTLVKKLNALDYAGACQEILRWDKFKGKPLRGLTIRRQKEFDLCSRS